MTAWFQSYCLALWYLKCQKLGSFSFALSETNLFSSPPPTFLGRWRSQANKGESNVLGWEKRKRKHINKFHLFTALIAKVAILKKHHLPLLWEGGNFRGRECFFFYSATHVVIHQMPTVCLALLMFESHQSGCNNAHFRKWWESRKTLGLAHHTNTTR